jgi:hypothetical protein
MKKIRFVNMNNRLKIYLEKGRTNINDLKNIIIYKNKLVDILNIYYFTLLNFRENFV